MDDGTRAAAVTAAQQLLLRYRAEHPRWVDDKTPVDELVAWLGLQVETFHPADYPAGTYGFLEPVEDLIWLCRDLSPTLRRFTLAHELGHAVLHRTTAQQSAA
ncbi:MAG TPA: ImmA/IrrE family metallo-endopeptidase, partial [Ktedonobacteraceae bacterium]|nr:ImmA/IrrE family metallo-endopeptidase [Ktedonobacteraceae bacterium]